jgi:uncharacterized membrane protein YvbJ
MDEQRFEQLEKDVSEIKKEVIKIRKKIVWDLSPTVGISFVILIGIAYMTYDMWSSWDSLRQFFNNFK